MRSVVVAGLVVAFFAGLIGWQLRGLDPGVVELQMAFDARKFGEIVHQWPAADLARFRAHLPLDAGLLASYAAFGWLLAVRTRTFSTLSPAGRRWAALAMPAAAAFDAAENLAHLWLTEVPRFGVPWAYPMAAGLATAKWILLLAWMLTLGWALLKSPR